MTTEEALTALNAKVLDLEKEIAALKGRGDSTGLEKTVATLKGQIDELMARKPIDNPPPPLTKKEHEEKDEIDALLGD